MRSVLNVISEIDRHIKACEWKLSYLRNLRSAIVPEQDGMPKSPNASKKVEYLAARIVDLEREISQLKQIELACQFELADWFFEKNLSEEVRHVLFMRYGLLKKFTEIARELNFSESTIYRFHRTGLKYLRIAPSISADYEFDSIAIES